MPRARHGIGSGINELYIHIPFCVRRCAYCDFASNAVSHDDPRIERYVCGVINLLEQLARAGLLAQVRTAYIGGGTPTMAREGLVRIVTAVREMCPGIVEFSSEANPESVSAALMDSLKKAGLTRVSLGVQSLINDELAHLGRVHSAAQALAAMECVRGAGLDLSCDVMCGIPLQTQRSLRATLEGIVGGGAQHVSVYPLMVEDGTALEKACSQGLEPYPDEDEQADMMLEARDILAAHGFERYEVASHALVGHACQHNIGYWSGVEYLGIGTSAASMLEIATFEQLRDCLPLTITEEPDDTISHDHVHAARVRLRMTDNAQAFAQAVEHQEPLKVELETLTAREALAEDLMLAMRMTRGVGRDLIGRAQVLGTANELKSALETAIERGLAVRQPDGSYAPTSQGWLLGNELYTLMWDLA